MFHGKHILVGVTGGIAAYKSALLVREFIKGGAQVKVIMTQGACDFITPLTLSVLSKNPVYMEFFNPQTGEWNNHVELGLWADAFVIAPATANSLGKMASGISDNLLLATFLSARCPVFVAPAMDLDMYKHPATLENIQKLVAHGTYIIPAENGELASGLSGEGRMAEPTNITTFISQSFSKNQPLYGKKVLITAGPTYEALDPVRFIGNRSTGLMGIEIAREFRALGAEVNLIIGPSHLEIPSGILTTRVETAQQMADSVFAISDSADFIVCAAAVADYRPLNPSAEKIKKHGDTLDIQFVKNTDILSELGKRKKEGQVLVGFALETQNEEENALGKLQRKNADIIVLNSLRDAGAGFGTPTNKITIFDKHGQRENFDRKEKNKVAADIVNKAVSMAIIK
jgi:phosphopantothenoylcysteine decarboxylase/phosphopantothenate--cysteine ligase